MRCKCKPRERKNDRVVVQEASVSRDSVGDGIPTWANTGSKWANVVPLNGREFQLAQQTTGEISHRVEMGRSKSLDITRKLRVIWTDNFDTQHTLNVEAVITPVGGNPREMNLMCKEQN